MYKIKAYAVLIDGNLVLNRMNFDEDSGFTEAHQISYERNYNERVELAEVNIEVGPKKPINSLAKAAVEESAPRLKKRKKRKRRLKKRAA